jgi:hypothetical protein
MSVILSLLGIVLAATGVAAIGFGIPINEFTLGTTLVLAGTTALAGGLILIGLAAVVAELGRITEALKTRVVARPAARTAETVDHVAPATASILPAPAPAPAITASVRHSPENAPSQSIVPPRLRHEAQLRDARPIAADPVAPPLSATDVSSNAIERLRLSIPRTERLKAEPSLVADQEDVPLSPNGAGHHQTQQPLPSVAQSEAGSKVMPAEDRAGSAAVDALKASRLDFLFRSKPARPSTSPENFDAFRPTDRRVGRTIEPAAAAPTLDEVQSQPDESGSVQEPHLESNPTREPATTILKSGVVEGMAYTLYADGSIEAELPDGTVRFGSIAELRAHIESNS